MLQPGSSPASNDDTRRSKRARLRLCEAETRERARRSATGGWRRRQDSESGGDGFVQNYRKKRKLGIADMTAELPCESGEATDNTRQYLREVRAGLNLLLMSITVPESKVKFQNMHHQNNQVLINQLQEITGTQDVKILQTALKASHGDVRQAIGFLTGQDPDAEVIAVEPSDSEGSVVGREGQTKVIDLTGNDKDDLQTAIELSLKESQTTQAEEQDLSRALEASVADNKSRVKRKRCEAWGDSSNPIDWIRRDEWPVGLKNVGNTCWFSAVIQSLFHLPDFRRLVLHYCLPQNVLENCKSHSEKRNIAFMQELRCLFALMMGSSRKFVDPSAAVELLKDAFRSNEAQQQDVSEFTHKLLDWLEDAFQLAANGNNPKDKQENPMVQLFYGTFLAERTLDGKTVSNIERFGQYPLQVNGFNNLDECLEGAMVEGEIEALHSDQTIRSGQERWFSKLPPVLTFELSRFEFNQSLGRPEKIHKKLEFPQVIYMDRYLYKNMEKIQDRRAEVKKLKEQVTVLQQKLESYLNYGSGPNKYPLADMLQYVLEFATTKPTSVSPTQDIKVTSPASTTTLSTPTDPVHEQTSPSETENSGPPDSSNSMPTSPPPQRTPIYKPFTQCRPPMDTPPHPAPHKVSEEELCFIKGCLHRWRTEVEQNIQELKDSIDRINHTLENMYTEDSMCQVPYRLHAVLVHEGQASAGHYWAYIFNHRCKLWLKYNDISVTESCWEELERDSYGGVKNASAYCLMYIDDKLPRLIAEDTDMETGQVLEGVDSLPPILRRYVQEDNRWFQQEVEEWEEEQFRKIAQKEPPVTITETQELSFTTVAEESAPSQQNSRSLSSEHAVIAKQQTAQAIAKTADCYEKKGVEAALAESDRESEAVGSTVECEARADSQPQDQPPKEGDKQAESQVSEVEIPSVGRILVRSDADGYNEEMMLTPAMQGVILAIAKAREVYDKDGPEAALIKAFHEEYSRLYLLAQEKASPQNDPRLQHVLIYLIQNEAPNRVVERTLLEQFADRNLSYDERSISIMKQARAKLRLIGPEDMDMDKYRQKWHEDYSLFRKVFVYLLTGLEQYQNGKVREALTYLVYAYQSNSTLLRNGENRGVEESLIALYRRKCLMELNENAAGLFDSGEDSDVVEGMSIMNDLVIPCMHLMISNDICQEDLDAIEIMRDRWCSYLGTDMDATLQEKLGEFLPRLLDCSAEIIILKEPPKIRPNSPHDLCSRFAAVLESIHGTSPVTVN
ncbi:ubiquitin carboxyl-terminal hydrolase 28-like isoform X5 [Acipenser ruthenus]|uniref:ubiquitin carboxyl-terminal hydrolase 28-like isoform X5 n=1 Tax=Acipenser ruthenus TaxID=7906 RepID=UPI002741E526|nr:ubiquitin carboxyl-terminal hydrolase 28-like isoform X5 [Acipenser ruthenus]